MIENTPKIIKHKSRSSHLAEELNNDRTKQLVSINNLVGK